MNDELTEQQQQALDAQPEAPLRLVDPRSNEVYVLLPLKHYEWIKALFEHDPLTKQEQLSLLREAGKRAGWDDPSMDVYDDLNRAGRLQESEPG